MTDQIQEIKDRINIVDLIGNYVPLKKSGVNFLALCPFHQERTPSFSVNEEKQIFKCFGCDIGGDIFTFMEKMEGLSFPEALKMLADRANVKLRQDINWKKISEEKDRKSRLFLLNAKAAGFFHFLLVQHQSGKAARDYLKKRGVNEQSIKKFQIGFAPQKSVLEPWLKKQGFSEAEIRNAGAPNRFRSRIIFPLRDTLGNVVGFTGRALLDGQAPKYLNTPETLLFQKGKTLYGLYESKTAIVKQHQALLVEGQMDVIMTHQADTEISVACSGTAITAQHMQILARYTNNLLLALDQDQAGFKASLKTMELALKQNLNLKIVQLPQTYKDAAEAILKNAKSWQTAVKNALPALDWLIDSLLAKHQPLDALAKKQIAKEILPFIAKIQDPIEQAHYFGRLSHELAVPEQSLVDAVNSLRTKTEPVNRTSTAKPSPKIAADEILIAIMALFPSAYRLIKTQPPIRSEKSLVQKIDKVLTQCYSNNQSPSVEQIIQSLRQRCDAQQKTKLELLLLEAQRMVHDQEPKIVAQELYHRLDQTNRDNLKQNLAKQIAQAESQGNRAKVKKLVVELQKLLK